jgi:hypothetical protein
MVAQGITTGFSDDIFGPDQPTQRAHVATFLWRYAGKPAAPDVATFSDVPASAYYADAVAWMVDEGITTGTGGGKFSPDKPTTRAQAVTFLWRLAGRPTPKGTSSFTDVVVGEWYAEAVSWAAETGITTGYTPAIFSPNLTVSRGEMATFLYRYDRVVGAGLPS